MVAEQLLDAVEIQAGDHEMRLFHKIFLINGLKDQDDGQVGRKSVRYEKQIGECDAPNDSLSEARAGLNGV